MIPPKGQKQMGGIRGEAESLGVHLTVMSGAQRSSKKTVVINIK